MVIFPTAMLLTLLGLVCQTNTKQHDFKCMRKFERHIPDCLDLE